MANISLQIFHGLIFVLTCFEASGFLLDNRPPISYSCTFEQSSCGYTHTPSSHGMEWSRHHVGPGHAFPEYDITYHIRGQGFVMYANGNASRHVGDNVKLQSQVMSFPKGQYVSIEFSYSFSEMHSNSLTLSLFAHGSSTNGPLLTRTGHSTASHGTFLPHWYRTCVSTLVRDGNITIVFEAITRYSSNNGNLAIDDVVIEEGKHCHSITQLSSTPSSHVTTTSHPGVNVSVTCDFESPNVCGYHNKIQPRDNFDWQRHRNATQSMNTGPNGDHTTGSGYYMYIETSSPRHAGEIARIESPSFAADGHQRLTFWYNAHGSGIGDLKVYFEVHGTLGSPVFVESKGTNNSFWQHACVPVTKVSSNAKVVFEGVVGRDYHGDIAIDDVKLDHGTCNNIGQTTVPTVTLDIGDWLSWGHWSACSSTCGHSTKQRTRKCSNGTCDGENIQVLQCHTNLCPGVTVDGQWSSWSSYSACSVTCGVGHVISRRACNNPPPFHGGHNCVGSSVKTATCHKMSCTFDGGWSHWTTWSKCSTSCDIGTISRIRSCTNPAPSSGGAQCSGNKTETHECSLGPCPTWSHWYDGKCSSTCGNGTMDRVRTCSTGTSADCSGSSYQLVPCLGTDCI